MLLRVNRLCVCAVSTILLMSGGLNTNQAFDWPIKTIGSVRSVITWNVLYVRLMGGGVGLGH